MTNSHETIKKTQKRLLFLSQLKRSNVGTTELVQFYRRLHPTNFEVHMPSLPRQSNYLSIERSQNDTKRALRIMFPWVSYDEAPNIAGLQ